MPFLATPRADADGLSADVVDPRELSAAARRRWRELMAADAALDSPFFAHAYIEAVAQCRPGVRVAVISRAHEIVAFFPFQWPSRWHARLRHAEPVGAHMSDAFGIVAQAGLILSPARLLRLCGIDYLFFTHLPRTQRRFGLDGEDPEAGLAIDLGMGAAAYWEEIRRRDKDLLHDSERRARRLLERFGPLRFVADAPDREAELSRLLDFKRAQYRRTGVADVFARPWTIELIRRLSRAADPDCRGVLATLHAGDRWVASHFGLRRGAVLHYWFPVYDPDLSAFAPGRLLLRALIDQAWGTGLRRIDRGAGGQQHKRDFANGSVTYFRGAWLRPGPRALIARAGMSLSWRIAALRRAP